ETLRTSTISLLITAVRSRVSRVRPVGISAPVLAAFTATPGSKRARLPGTRMSTTTIQILTTPAHLHHECAGGTPILTYGWLRRRSLLAPSHSRIDLEVDDDH